MTVILLIALINLGLGFAIAVYAGRGPWSRNVRRPEAAVEAAPIRSETAFKPAEQITRELDELEHGFSELLQRFTEEPVDTNSLEELLGILRTMTSQVESLNTDPAEDYHEQTAAGLRNLYLALRTATKDLSKLLESSHDGLDPVALLTSLQMSCREVRTVFNALLFAEMPH
jgi:hypothetical protein